MRLLIALLVFSVAIISTGCQRTGLPYGGVDKKADDKAAVQPDPARAE